MKRWLPWILVAAGVGAVVLLALPMLRGSGSRPASADLRGAGVHRTDRAGATLRGTGEAGPAATALGARHRIVGRVLDADGRPAAGVLVRVERGRDRGGRSGWLRRTLDEVAGSEGLSRTREGECRSAEDGSFTFAVREGRSHFVTALPNPPLCGSTTQVWFSTDDTEQKVTLRVAKCATLDGRVVDATGHGVASRVTASYWSIRVHYESDGVSTNPDDGSFRLTGLPAGRWRLSITVPPHLLFTGIEVEVPHDGVSTYRLGEGTGRVEGRVTTPAGGGVPNAEVLVQTGTGGNARSTTAKASARAVTDAEGRYEMDGVAAGAVTNVGVLADGMIAYLEAPPLATWSGATVEAGARTEIDVVVRAGAILTGRVFDEKTRAGLADAQVYAVTGQQPGSRNWGGSSPLHATTGRDGHYRIEGVAPGKYLLVATQPTHYQPGLWSGRQVFVRGSQSSTSMTLLPPGLEVAVTGDAKEVERDLPMRAACQVSGIVVDPDDHPVAGAALQSSGDSLASAVTQLGYQFVNALWSFGSTDASGRFALANLPPRDGFVLIATHDGFVAGASEPFSTHPDAGPGEIEIHLERGATITGRFLGPRGEGLEGWVHAYSTAPGALGSPARASAGSDGTYRLEGVVPGTANLNASCSEGSVTRTVEQLKPGETREGVDLRIAEGVRVSGVVVGPDDAPVTDLSLSLSPVDSPTGESLSRGTRTDADGRFTFENAPPGRVRISVTETLIAGYGVSVPLGAAFEAPANDVRLVYEPLRRLVVEGRVLDPKGAPVPECRVLIEATQSSRSSLYAGRGAGEVVVDGAFRREVDGGFPVQIIVLDARDAAGNPLNVCRASARVADASGLPVTLRLEAGREVTGLVVGPDGKGVSNVVVKTSSEHTWTDENGRFTLPGLEEKGEALEVAPPDGFVTPEPVSIPAGQQRVEIRLERALSITGSIAFSDGRPVTNGWVEARWHHRGEQAEKTAYAQPRGGRFEVRGLPEDAVARLHVRTWGAAPLQKVVEDVAAGATGLSIVFDEGLSIRGTVVAADGSPARGGSVHLWPDGKSEESVWAQIRSNGTFEAQGLQSVPYRLAARTRAGAEATEALLVVPPADDVRLALPALLSIRGRVVGAPSLDRFSVWATPFGGGVGGAPTVTTEADGTFTLEGVAEGRYVLRARSGEDDRYGEASDVDAGATGVEISLRTGLSIEGTVTESDGSDVTDGWVMAHAPGWYASARIQEGRFRIRALPRGRYTLDLVRKVGAQYVSSRAVAEADAGAANVLLRAP